MIQKNAQNLNDANISKDNKSLVKTKFPNFCFGNSLNVAMALTVVGYELMRGLTKDGEIDG